MVILTSVGSEKLAAEAINLGAVGYVIKGHPEHTLVSLGHILERVFREKRLEEENHRLLEKLRQQNDRLEKAVSARTADLEKAIQELKSVDRMKTDFVTLVSHEMRTPLTSILGFSELVVQGLYENEQELGEILRSIHVAGLRLNDFVNESLELFLWYSGKHELDLRSIVVDEWVGRASDRVAALVEEKSLELQVGRLGEEALIEGDERVLDEALFRVLENAAKFSRQGGRIRVQPRLRDRVVVVEIEDDGIGIDPRRLKSLFKPLEICGDLNHHSEGKGLGLVLVQEALRAHGGRITVRSGGIDRGTGVSIHVPREIPEAIRKQHAASTEMTPG